MDKFIRECAIARFFAAFARAFKESVPGKIKTFFSRSYHNSKTRVAFVSFLSVTPKIVFSKTYNFFLKINTALFNFGKRLAPVFEKSLIGRAVIGFGNSTYINNSSIFSAVRKLGIKRFLIALFALYLPLDVFIRDVLNVGFISAVWDEAFMLFCILFIAYRVMTAKDIVKPRITPIDAPLLFFISVGLLLVAVVSPKIGPAIDGYRAVCQFMLWFFVLTRLIEDDSDYKTFYFTLSALAIVISLHGIYQYITKAPMPEAWVAQAEMGVRTRVYSIFGSPNVMGAFLIMTAPMLASLAYYTKKLWLKCLMWGATGIACLATLFTFSRGAWFGLTIAVFVFALIVDRKLLLIAGAAILGIIFCVPEISNRIMFLFTADFAAANSTGGRGERWAIGLELWQTNPFWGFGLGRYGGAIAMQNKEIDDIVYYYMDNYYLKTLTEMGILGLVSYVWLLLKNLLWSCRSLFRSQKNRMSVLSAGLLSGEIGVLAHSFFENIFEVPYMNSYFWGFAALIMYLGFLRRRKNDK